MTTDTQFERRRQLSVSPPEPPGTASDPEALEWASVVQRPEGPVWLAGTGVPILGWVHVPSRPTGASVVLCPPLFGEHVSSHFVYRDLARRLADVGIVAVRFDYPGTGDSAPLPAGSSPAPAWLDGVDRAVDTARSYAAGRVALVGMRMGAVVAALAARRRGDVDALVLWDPCDSGRAFLRRQRSLHLLQFGHGGEEGTVEVPGAVLGREVVAGLTGLRLPGTPVARRTLILSRKAQAPGVPAPPTVPGRDGAGSTVEAVTLPAGEQEALLDVDPSFRQAPAASMVRIVHWLRGALAAGGAAAATRPMVPDPAILPARPAVAPMAVSVAAQGGDVAVHERVRWLGPARLFAVETVPADPEVPCRRPVVVLVPQGNDRHTASGELWVDLARRWASVGFRCLRVDVSGLGESPARPGLPEQVIRAPEAFDDVDDVIRAVADDPADVVLVGLCSSGYQVLEAAIRQDVLGVLVINPVLRFVPPETFDGGPASPQRKICVARPPWVTAVRRRLPVSLGRRAAAVRAWLERRRAGDRLAWQQELVRRGVQAYCLCGEIEAGPLVGPSGAELRTAASAGRFQVDIVEGLDHALLRARDRAVAAERLTRQLERLDRP